MPAARPSPRVGGGVLCRNKVIIVCLPYKSHHFELKLAE